MPPPPTFRDNKFEEFFTARSGISRDLLSSLVNRSAFATVDAFRSDNVSENDEYFVCNILTNTSRYGTNFPSAIYLVDSTKNNDRSTDLATAAFCNNYYSVIDHNERSNADIDILHLDQTLPSVPSTGRNMVFNDYPNRAAAVN